MSNNYQPSGWVEAPSVRVGRFTSVFTYRQAKLYQADCLDFLRECQENSIHAVVTDPPYGMHEYTEEQQAKLRAHKGGIWRIPPSFDGHQRAPLPASLSSNRPTWFTWNSSSTSGQHSCFRR